jgi:hypothetical protein
LQRVAFALFWKRVGDGAVRRVHRGLTADV